jgi:hypothetical protein
MNPWQQTRKYTCFGCGEKLLHDLMHSHWAFKCPARLVQKKGKQAFVAKTYEPKAGR